MGVTSLKTSSSYTNADGLRVNLGIDEGTVTKAGEYTTTGGKRRTEVVLNLASLPVFNATDAVCIIAENVVIPAGAFIESIEVFTLKETAGSNANLDLGLVDQDRTTEIDFNGFLAAADIFNGGTDLGSLTSFAKTDGTLTTEAGALVGTRITNTGLICANNETASFTAGVLKITIVWHVPLTTDV